MILVKLWACATESTEERVKLRRTHISSKGEKEEAASSPLWLPRSKMIRRRWVCRHVWQGCCARCGRTRCRPSPWARSGLAGHQPTGCRWWPIGPRWRGGGSGGGTHGRCSRGHPEKQARVIITKSFDNSHNNFTPVWACFKACLSYTCLRKEIQNFPMPVSS